MQASNFGSTFDQLFLWIFLWNFHRRCLSTFSIPWCKKVKNDQKLKSRGPALTRESSLWPKTLSSVWEVYLTWQTSASIAVDQISACCSILTRRWGTFVNIDWTCRSSIPTSAPIIANERKQHLNNRRWDNKPIIPKKTQQTDLMFSHNPIFALFSSVAIQRERTTKEQGNIYSECEVLCWECVCAVYVCEMFVWLLVYVSTNFYDGCVRCVRWNNVRLVTNWSNIVSVHTTHAPIIEVGRYIH